jgi:hypothetical protein
MYRKGFKCQRMRYDAVKRCISHKKGTLAGITGEQQQHQCSKALTALYS